MWNEIYPAKKKGIKILAKGEKLLLIGKVWINNVCIKSNTFTNQTLSWSESGGNSSNAELKFVIKGDLVYSISGKYWRDNSSKPSSDNLNCQNSFHICVR